ncbi:MAG: nitrate reductase molybdenum cofactor assembly chaperone [Alphaproteobacteria bacterium]|nr:nitrate reductase molybdenum cofactor assembly chaperone [Alphaproteobacteria bacterium]MDD9919069.1 nitrate reductase molybdenum cofactor assembly chaperone [Alphaproteobacteria bacterium]
MQIYTLLSALLQYPTADMQADIAEAEMLLTQDKLLSRACRQEVKALLAHVAQTDLLTLQMQYVDLFDRTPALALHLFEHVYGDDRARGQALADLQGVYAEAGLELNPGELPDYLPLFLAYLAAVPVETAQESLKELVDLLEILHQRLVKRKTPYAAVLRALVALAKLKPNQRKVQDALKLADGSLPDPEKVDALWAEEPAFNGTASAASCPHAQNCQQGGAQS